MRSILLALFFAIPATPACAQVYAELDSMADQVRVTENNVSYSPRITLGFENEDVGTRVRYWHLNTTVGLGVESPDYNDNRYHFDVFDWDVYKQYTGLRLFGGLRGGYLTFSALSSPAISSSARYPYGISLYPNYLNNSEDSYESSVTYTYDLPPGTDYSSTSTASDSIHSAIFGPTAGLEGDVPIIGNLWIDYGLRCSFLLANWYTSGNYTNSYVNYPYNLYYSNYYSNYYGPYRTTTSISQGGHFADTLFVPEIYTGLALRWTYAELGVKFEVQKWQSDNDNYSFQSPTIVGIGGTLTARY